MATYRFKRPQADYIDGLEQYLAEMRAHRANLSLPTPNPTLLTRGLERWLPGIVSADVIHAGDEPNYVAVTFNKPKRAGTTKRYCDPEFLFVAVLHVLHGGIFAIEAHGPDKLHFYWRVRARGHRIGLIGRTYALRLVVGTAVGLLTKEAWEHHDLRRSELGKLILPKAGTPAVAKHGRNMVDWSVASFDAAPPRQLLCATSRDYGQLIWEAYQWLDAIPLGSPPQAQA